MMCQCLTQGSFKGGIPNQLPGGAPQELSAQLQETRGVPVLTSQTNTTRAAYAHGK